MLVMDGIKEFEFNEHGLQKLKELPKRNTLLRLKKYIQTQRGGKAFKIGFVFPMPGIRGTIKNVFKECGNGLVSEMVICPTDVIKEDYILADMQAYLDKNYRQQNNEIW